MMKNFPALALAALLLFIFPYCSHAAEQPINGPGDYEFTLTHGGRERAFLIHVPPGYDPARAAPLVIALHGGGGSMHYMARDSLYELVSKSDSAGFIAVFPNGYSRFRGGKFATWNAGACCGDARDKNIDDVGFIKSMVGFLHTRLHIDRDRVFATGMSNGGMMAYRLACELPDIFAAVAPVAGTDNTTACPAGRPVSVLHIHARNDTHVLYEGGAGPDAFRDPSKVTSFASVPATVEKWRVRNNCPARARRVLDAPGAACDLYAPCADQSAVKLCVTETGGHSWPGGKKPRGEAPSQALSANDIMWEFFKSLK